MSITIKTLETTFEYDGIITYSWSLRGTYYYNFNIPPVIMKAVLPTTLHQTASLQGNSNCSVGTSKKNNFHWCSRTCRAFEIHHHPPQTNQNTFHPPSLNQTGHLGANKSRSLRVVVQYRPHKNKHAESFNKSTPYLYTPVNNAQKCWFISRGAGVNKNTLAPGSPRKRAARRGEGGRSRGLQIIGRNS